MTEFPEISLYMHRLGEWHSRQMEAIARLAGGSYTLHITCQPGNVHVNMNRALDRCCGRYTCLMDDDCIPLGAGWLEACIAMLREYPKFGIVAPVEIKDCTTLRTWFADPTTLIHEDAPPLLPAPWLPGYCMVIDRRRLPAIRVDENIVGDVGMSDLQLTLDARRSGFGVAHCTKVVVWHPFKGPCQPWQHELNTRQCEYMRSKYGNLFDEVVQQSIPAILRDPSVNLATLDPVKVEQYDEVICECSRRDST